MNKFAKLRACLSNGLYASALIRHGVAAAVEHETVLSCMNCRTVVDIGANRGQFALVSRRCFPSATIVSFEPQPQPATRLRKVLARDNNAEVHVAAVGSGSGKVTMHVSHRDDSSSLLPIGSRQTEVFPGTAEAGTIDVRLGRLEEFLGAESIMPPALLKIDVQGFELQALQGCEALLNRFAYVYVECSFIELYPGQALLHEVKAWLKQRGFRLTGTHNMSYDVSGQEVQADFLFTANRT